MSSNDYFTKQRDLLLQDITNNLTQVHKNLETLNRSMNELVQIGKEFDDVGRLWSVFYDGMNELKERQLEQNKNTSQTHQEEEEEEDDD